MFIFIFLVNSWFVFVVSYLFTTSADCLVHVAFMFVWLAKPPLNRGTEVPHDVQSNTNVRNIKNIQNAGIHIYKKRLLRLSTQRYLGCCLSLENEFQTSWRQLHHTQYLVCHISDLCDKTWLQQPFVHASTRKLLVHD